MKQFAFLMLVTLVGGCASIAAPFWGVMLYYGLATLRPQHLWAWALADTPHVRWSLVAGTVAITAFIIHLATIIKTARTNKVLALIVVYGVLMTLSVLTAFNPKVAQFWLEEYAKVLGLAILASLVIQRLWQVRAMGFMIALCIGYIAFEINHLYLSQGGRLDIFHEGYGGLDNNGAGALIALGLPFAYFLAVSRVGAWVRPRRILAVVLGLMMLHAVMMTYSRGAMLAAAIGVGWLLMCHRPRMQSIAAACMLALALSVMAGPEIRDRFASTAQFQTDDSAQSRFASWNASWRMVWQHPVLGKGIRNSNTYTENYGADMAGRTVHNQYLQVAADSGVPAATAYTLMLGLGIFGVGRARRRLVDGRHKMIDELDDNQIARIDESIALCSSIQAAVVMFSTSAMFLSVELVELPWLLIVLAGVTPAAADAWLRSLERELGDEHEPLNPQTPKFGPPAPQDEPAAEPDAPLLRRQAA